MSTDDLAIRINGVLIHASMEEWGRVGAVILDELEARSVAASLPVGDEKK
jgi:hypothetical protein